MTDADEDSALVFYTVAKIALIFEVTEQTVRAWIKKGDMPSLRLPNGSYRVQKSDLIEFAKSKYDVGVE